jgi:uncharacterized protein
MKKVFILTVFLIMCCGITMAQDSIIKNGFNIYYYPDGKKSSEGYMRDGNPDGYWKTYYENGVLKSEGNRKNFVLDSTWRFYSDSGKVVLEINYKEGKKNGIRKTFQNDETLEENFVDDIKQGYTKWYYPNGALKKKVFFADGREEGLGKEYSVDGTVITLTDYKKGYILNSENINRYRSGLKHGNWKLYFDDESLKEEGTYNYGKKDGYFKEYDKKGNLVSIRKFNNDSEIYDAPELTSYEIRTDYYKNGKKKIVASYKDDVPEGVRREYDQQGNITKSYIFKSGIIVGQGIIDESGLKQGPWKEFYESGELYGEGLYKDGKRQESWIFYYKDGKQEQTGNYNAAGKPEGVWKWYYESGNLKRRESMSNGLSNGPIKEFSDSGVVLVNGSFVDGEEDGEWFYEVNDDKETGSYREGKKEGDWKCYSNGNLYFEGSYEDGQPNGMHIYYWDNGKVKEKGKYISGQKEGDWVIFDYYGVKLLTITYEDGVEISFDGVKIDNAPGK